MRDLVDLTEHPSTKERSRNLVGGNLLHSSHGTPGSHMEPGLRGVKLASPIHDTLHITYNV